MFLLSESCKSLESVRLAPILSQGKEIWIHNALLLSDFAFYHLTKFQAFRCYVAEPNATCMARRNEKREGLGPIRGPSNEKWVDLISVQLTVIGLDLDLSFGAVTDNLR